MQAMLLLAVLAALLPLHHCVSPTEPTFNDIKAQCQPVPGSATPQCAKGQWVITLELGDKNSPDAWTPLYAGNATVPLGTCSSPGMGACFGPGKPLGDPIQVLSTRELKVTYTWKSIYNSMVLFNLTTMVPSQLKFKLCYSDVAFAGRAWRKQNKPYPRLTQNCMFSVKDISVPASIKTSSLTQADKDSLSGTFVYEFDDDTMPSATLFMMMWVECSDARVCAFESLESPSYSVPSQGILEYPPQYVSSNPAPYNVPGPYNGTYIQVQGYNPITPGMTAGAIVLSIFGPVFFICYFIADHISYTRTGKALAW